PKPEFPMLVSSPLRSSSRSFARALPGATLAPFPAFIQPCLALPRTEVPTARGLVHELKLDGYRVQAHIRDGRVRLYTRGGFDWTSRFATIVAGMTRLPAGKLVLDGEIICAGQDGRPDFSALQDDLKRGRVFGGPIFCAIATGLPEVGSNMWPANIVGLTTISKLDHTAVSIGRGNRSPSNSPWAVSLPDRRAERRSLIAVFVGAHLACLMLMIACSVR